MAPTASCSAISRADAGSRSGAPEQMSYAELHAHSAYSFLDGASTPEELAAAAAVHGYSAVALTDHDNLCGAMEFAHACKGLGIRAIIGAEVTIDDGTHLTLLCENRKGYSNLCRLLTLAHSGTRDWDEQEAGGAARPPRMPQISLEQVEQHSA